MERNPSSLLAPGRPVYVRAPNWVGDVVMATAVLEAIANKFNGQVVVGLRPHLAPLLTGLMAGKKILPAGRPRSFSALRAELKGLRSGGFQAALILPRSFETGLLPWLARIPHRFGTLEGRSLLMTAGFREPKQQRRMGREPKRVPRYMADLFAEVARLAGVEVGDTKPVLAVLPAEEEALRVWRQGIGLGPEERFFLLNPGAAYGASKLWPPDYMARVGTITNERTGLRGVVLSGPAREEQKMAGQIAAAGKGLLAAAEAHLVRLGPLKALVQAATWMVTTDSGPRHFAVAFGIPHVVVMGPTDPRFTAKHLEQAQVLRVPMDCGPCHLRKCPYLHHSCMADLTPELVIAAGVEQGIFK